MQKSVTKYFKAADAAINNVSIANNGKIQSAYKGAVSAFGASLVMSGPVPTLQFYMAESTKRDAESSKIVEAIAKTISPEWDAEILKNEVMKLERDRAGLYALKKKIVDAAIALKIMMRTYEFVKEKKEKPDTQNQ